MIEKLSLIDKELFFLINSWNTTWLNPFMVFISGQIIWVPFIGLILYFAYTKNEKKTFSLFILFMLLGLIASDVTSSYILKNIVQRLRPCRVAEIKALINNFGQKCGGRFGFVSSHAANSIFLLIFSFIVLEFKSKRVYFLLIIPLLVGLSRIYLGVHYPGDVLGGIFVGTFWGIILAGFFKHRQTLWSKPA